MNNQKVCSFYISEFHLLTIVLPYINPKLEIDNNIEVEYSKEVKKEEAIKEIIISENLNLYDLAVFYGEVF